MRSSSGVVSPQRLSGAWRGGFSVNWVCVCDLSLVHPVWWIRVRSREFRSQRVYPDSANRVAQLGYRDIGYILLAHGAGSDKRSVRG
jgi:hypothetical protein